jgi:sugar/nucleoside kinase (ribokinase family)
VILSLGELLWDVHVEPGGTLETGERLRRVPGGATSNVALELARRGLDVGVAGVLSDDAMGRGLAAALEASGIDTTRVVHLPGRTGVVFLDRNQSSHERFVSYRPSLGGFRSTTLPDGLRALHLAALHPDLDELGAYRELAAEARRRGAWVVVDANVRPLPWRQGIAPTTAAALVRLLAEVDVLKASDSDLAVLERATGPVAAPLASSGGTLFVTRGGEPTAVSGPWGAFARRPPSVTLVRSIGAGDAFVAGLVEHLASSARAQPRAEPGFWLQALNSGHASAARRVSTMW